MPRVKGQKPKTDIKKNKLPVGRQPVYRPEFCERLVEHMRKGGSFPSFAAEIGTHWDTLYDWCTPESPRFHPEFSVARKAGEACLLRFDENIGTAGITGRLERVSERLVSEEKDPATGAVTRKIMSQKVDNATFAQSAWIFRMKNRFPEFYKDRQDLALSDPDGNAMSLNGAQVIVNIPSNGREQHHASPAAQLAEEEDDSGQG